MSTHCPCGSQVLLSECCERFISGQIQPETAEQLMRARYTAYCTGRVEYVQHTLAPEALRSFDRKASEKWAKTADWRGLKVLNVKAGGRQDRKGVVEFVATYGQDGEEIEHHEVSRFRRNGKGEWQYVDGDFHTHAGGQGHHHHHHHQDPPQTVVREQPKIGRNDACPCGSGKKFKKCHGQAS